MQEQFITQEKVERFLSKCIQWTNEAAVGSLINGLHPRLDSYDIATNSAITSYPTSEWGKNPNGVIHGGIIASMLDTAMGSLTSCVAGKNTPTISLQISYLCPVPLGDRFVARAHITKCGNTVIYTIAEAWMESRPDTLVATAQGIYHDG